MVEGDPELAKIRSRNKLNITRRPLVVLARTFNVFQFRIESPAQEKNRECGCYSVKSNTEVKGSTGNQLEVRYRRKFRGAFDALTASR